MATIAAATTAAASETAEVMAIHCSGSRASPLARAGRDRQDRRRDPDGQPDHDHQERLHHQQPPHASQGEADRPQHGQRPIRSNMPCSCTAATPAVPSSSPSVPSA